MFTVSLPIPCAVRLPWPPRRTASPTLRAVHVAESVAAHLCTQLIPQAKIITSLTIAAYETLMQRVTLVAVEMLAQEWPRVVEAERVRHAAAIERHR